MSIQDNILKDIRREREEQDYVYGRQKHKAERWFLILSEEVGELGASILENRNIEDLRKEAIQVASVAVAFVEHIDEVREMEVS